MIARAGSGWQTVLADLSLILFMVTAAALSQVGEGDGRKAAPAPVSASPQAEPLAVWRPGPGAPALARWLEQQSADHRQQLSIVAHYARGDMGPTLDLARGFGREAEAAGLSARVVVEPGADGISATLAYDAPEPAGTTLAKLVR